MFLHIFGDFLFLYIHFWFFKNWYYFSNIFYIYIFDFPRFFIFYFFIYIFLKVLICIYSQRTRCAYLLIVRRFAPSKMLCIVFKVFFNIYFKKLLVLFRYILFAFFIWKFLRVFWFLGDFLENWFFLLLLVF